MSMELRWYQEQAVESTISYLCNEIGNPVICLPTGSGKSIVIAELCRRAVKEFNGRVVVLQHREELIKQNAAKIQSLLPGVRVGIYSAGLNSKQSSEDVVVAGIQSIYKKAMDVAPRQLILIDECHLVPNEGDGMYQTFLSDLFQLQDCRYRVVGLTATPFRTGQGPICGEGKVFDAISYNANINDLIKHGFLCNLTSKPADFSVDTSRLRQRNGEFLIEEVEGLFHGDAIKQAVGEIVGKTADRHSIMIFCTSVRHAETVENLLKIFFEHNPECVASIFGHTSPLERSAYIRGFVEQRIRFLINVDVLTTGFDAPCVDAICILRATASPGLYAQIVGRGLRVHESKKDCLVLDFGENILRHGSIDNVRVRRPKDVFLAADGTEVPLQPADANEEEKTTGNLCPACEQLVPTSQLICECGFRFPPVARHNPTSDQVTNIIGKTPPKVFNVLEVHYSRWKKADKPTTMRVDYKVTADGVDLPAGISEWVCFEHQGFARDKAHDWWTKRSNVQIPDTVDDAVTIATLGGVAEPNSLIAEHDGKFWRIKKVQIDGDLPGQYEILEEAPF